MPLSKPDSGTSYKAIAGIRESMVARARRPRRARFFRQRRHPRLREAASPCRSWMLVQVPGLFPASIAARLQVNQVSSIPAILGKGVVTALLGKKMRRRSIIILASCLPILGYLGWLSAPHFAPIAIEGDSQIPAEDLKVIIEALEKDNGFPERGRISNIMHSFINPYSRRVYYAHFEKVDSDFYRITTGFESYQKKDGYGSGYDAYREGRKRSDEWQVSRTSNWHCINQ